MKKVLYILICILIVAVSAAAQASDTNCVADFQAIVKSTNTGDDYSDSAIAELSRYSRSEISAIVTCLTKVLQQEKLDTVCIVSVELEKSHSALVDYIIYQTIVKTKDSVDYIRNEFDDLAFIADLHYTTIVDSDEQRIEEFKFHVDTKRYSSRTTIADYIVTLKHYKYMSNVTLSKQVSNMFLSYNFSNFLE